MNYLESGILWGPKNNIEYEGETHELERMFMVVEKLNVKLQKDGDQWCYVYGDLPEPNCIAGFGDTPEQALREFYAGWKR